MAKKINTYLIPKRLLKKSTLFDGIGLKEVGILGIGGVISLVLWFALSINIFIKMLIVVIPVGACFLLVMPSDYQENALTKIQRVIKYKKSTQIYYYTKRR